MSEINQNAGDNSNQIGNIHQAKNIYMGCTFNPLNKGDLDDSILRRLGVSIFLVSVFLFWGLMAIVNCIPVINSVINYFIFISFPFAELSNLIKCCLGGNFENKINHYAQQKLQSKKRKNNDSRNKEYIKNLNNKVYVYWLCLEIIDRLGGGNFEGHRRIFENIEFLEQKILETLEKLPRKCKKILNFHQIKIRPNNHVEVNKIIRKIYRKTKNTPGIKYEDILKQVNQEIESNYTKICPSVLKNLYTTRQLIEISLASDITNKAENKYIWDVKSKNYHYSKDCQYWKALMYDHLINYDAQREIIVSKNKADIHRESKSRNVEINLCSLCQEQITK
ncbi:MAG: hypothetical protein F6K22_26380 [Okeania sp. SIO2F4]|uniref:hypothetical protein n=1 Tax=Okeania sp. SIO2F4 TaxID=2607790 RepID=UPI00142923E7|nr:hypothetical protein [Okeania sp. SIO2F4]NES06018.1 hypothetical protein [Okeania sp. SIO2F4]